MKDTTTAQGVIELVCDGDHPLGRKVITVGEMVEMMKKMEIKEAICG
ncbi:hypothetical protein [Brevibacillus reuszeri]|nr:hypothetical protein [Brevibacillus reuszeri]